MTNQDPFSTAFPNPFESFLEDAPEGFRARFFGRPETRGTPARARFFQSQFDEIQNLFLGRLGAQIEAGGQPDLRGGEFLDQLDLNQFFLSQSPFFRGALTSRFNPRARFIFGR